MDLKRLVIQLEADGFRLIDKGAELDFTTQLNIRYQVQGGEWTTKVTPFEREAPTFFHPFRKSMFIYTGARPTRVLVGLMDGGFTDDLDTGDVQARRSYYQRNNFRSYPDFDDDSWDYESTRPFFSSRRSSSHSHEAAAASGAVDAAIPTDFAPPPPPPPPPPFSAPPPPPPPPPPAPPLREDVPLEREDSREPVERDVARWSDAVAGAVSGRTDPENVGSTEGVSAAAGISESVSGAAGISESVSGEASVSEEVIAAAAEPLEAESAGSFSEPAGIASSPAASSAESWSEPSTSDTSAETSSFESSSDSSGGESASEPNAY